MCFILDRNYIREINFIPITNIIIGFICRAEFDAGITVENIYFFIN